MSDHRPVKIQDPFDYANYDPMRALAAWVAKYDDAVRKASWEIHHENGWVIVVLNRNYGGGYERKTYRASNVCVAVWDALEGESL